LRLTKERGYSLDEVGAPLFDRHGKVGAAVSLSAPSSRLQGDIIHDAAKAVMATAEAISQRLKSWRRKGKKMISLFFQVLNSRALLDDIERI
jgi:transcriptional regulator of acetoin/glycerol metabolism